jgi:chromosomal replication initiator protein
MADGGGFGTMVDGGLDALWTQVRATLRERVGAGSFQSWISPLRLAAMDGGVATLMVPTAFLGSYVARNFHDDILAALAAAGRPATRLLFAPRPRAAALATAPAGTPAEVAVGTPVASPAAAAGGGGGSRRA